MRNHDLVNRFTKKWSGQRTPPPCTEADLPPPPPMVAEQIAAIARALSHPTRVQIVHQFLACTPHIVQEIVGESDLAQSTVSEHLRILREADVLFVRTDGPRHWYCLRRSVLREFAHAVAAMAAEPARDPLAPARVLTSGHGL